MAARLKSRKTDFQAAFEGFAAGAFGQTGKLRWFALFEWWIDAATNEKWVSRRLLTCGLGFNLIMVLLVRLFANKVERQSALFCKMGGYGFYVIIQFSGCRYVGFIHHYFKAVCAENGVSGSLKPPKKQVSDYRENGIV